MLDSVPMNHQLIAIEHTGIDPEDFVAGSWPLISDFDFLPGYFIALDRTYGAVVIALRGSTTHKDWLTDLCGAYEPFCVRRAATASVDRASLTLALRNREEKHTEACYTRLDCCGTRLQSRCSSCSRRTKASRWC